MTPVQRADLSRGILAALPAAQALRRLDAPRIVDGEAGAPARLAMGKAEGGPTMVSAPARDASEWRALAASLSLVCVERGGVKVVATHGPEPTGYREHHRLCRAKRLGRGGLGRLLTGVDGLTLVTHNLSADLVVPAEFAGLFRATHVSCRPMTLHEENAHWTALDEWVQEAA